MKIKLTRTILTAISALALVSAAVPLAQAAEPSDPTKNYTGLNTWFAVYWDGVRPFTDMMHGGSIQLAVDSSSIPLSDFTTVWNDGSSASYSDPHQTTWVDHQLRVNGTYNLQFTGQAAISVPYSGPFTISGQTYNSTTNITTATLTVAYPDDALVPKQIRLKFTNTQRTPTSPVGSGISGISLTYPASVTVDNHTLAGVANSGYPITDANGWPTSDFFVALASDNNLTGTYTLIFNGKATVTSQYGGFSVGALTYNSTTNTSTGTVILSSTVGGVNMKFLNTQRTSTSGTNTGITNLQFYRPGYPTDGSKMISSEYGASMAKVDVIRFMDWGSTNTNTAVNWADRSRPANAWNSPVDAVDANGLPAFGTNGVPYELMVRFSNANNSDLYICVPARANDAYITNLANLIKYGSDGANPYTSTQTNPVWPPLNSNLKVYVEFSNEVWNSQFGQWGETRGAAEVQLNSPTVYPIEYDGATDLGTLQVRYDAYRASQISLLFRAVFGDSAMPGTSSNPRVRPLFESQLGNAGGMLSPGLKFLDAFYSSTSASTPPNNFNTTVHPLSYFFYGGGGSAYYSISGVSSSTNPDPSVVFAPGTGHYVPTGFAPVVYADSLWLKNYGLKRVAYEGGMGLPTIAGTWTSAAEWTIDTDSRMVEVEQEFHDAWTQAGGDLLNYYTNGATPQWGFTPDFDNQTAAKLLGLDSIRAGTRPNTVTQASVIQGSSTTPVTVTVPIASLDGSHRISLGSQYYTATPEPTVDGVDPGEWIAFGVDAPLAATYSSVIRYRKYNTVSSTVEIWVNGVLSSTQTVPGTSNAMGNSAPFNVTLPAGFSAVRIRCTAGGIAIASESFTLPDVTSGLVARWNFDNNATDTSTAGSVADNGTLVGSPTYATGGPVGAAALSLNGTSQYMTVPTSTDVNLTTACTLAAWVKIASATDNSYRMIFSKKITYTDTTGYELFYHPVLHQVLLRSGGDSTSYSMTFPLTLDTNWHHLAVTINGSVATLYVDGVAQTGATGTVANPTTGTQTLTIGRRSGTTDYPWNGQLDDVRIYNRALSASEIDTIYIQEQ